MWVVGTNSNYYPDVAFFDNYEKALEFYEFTLSSDSVDVESECLYIAKIEKLYGDQVHDAPWYIFNAHELDKTKEK